MQQQSRELCHRKRRRSDLHESAPVLRVDERPPSGAATASQARRHDEGLLAPAKDQSCRADDDVVAVLQIVGPVTRSPLTSVPFFEPKSSSLTYVSLSMRPRPW